jgi:hypothetical protein
MKQFKDVLGRPPRATAALQPFDEITAHAEPRRRGGRQAKGRLGQLLVGRGILAPAELKQALAEQKRSGRRLGEVLLELGFVSGPVLVNVLAEQCELTLELEGGFGFGLRKAIVDRHGGSRTPADNSASAEAAAWVPAAPAPQPTRRRLGEMLMIEGLLTPEELDAALQEQDDSGRPLGEIILRRGLISAPTLVNALAQQIGQLELESGYGSGLRNAIVTHDLERAGAA